MKNSKLNAEQIARTLAQLNAGLQTPWQEQQGKLCKSFTFASFAEAFAFMTQLALVAERIDHHPDWRNCHRRVEIALSSFDVRGLSQRDFEFAARAERAAEQLLREF